MTGFVGRLRAKLGLDTAEFDAGMGRAQTRARTGFAGAFAGLGRLVTPITAGLAAAAAGAYSVAAPALAAAGAVDEIAKAARRVDGSFAGWSSLRLAATEAGVEVSSLSDQIQNMNARLAAPNDDTRRALAGLGLDAATLRAMDVDDRVAAIGDAVAGLGLDAGQTGAALQRLGIEDRRMVGLIMAGGAGIRAARADIADYGLAVSDIDASAIEAANDQIGRLSLVSRYWGQAMAVAVVPALGQMAQGLTESLRTGGALRTVIDGLAWGVSSLVGVVSDVLSIGAAFTRWLADLATGSIAGTGFLHDMAVTLGNMAGEVRRVVRIASGVALVSWFADLTRGAGGFGQALTLLGDVAAGVWSGIVESARGVPIGLQAVWASVASGFTGMVSHISELWARAMGNIAGGLQDNRVLSALGLGSAASAGFDALSARAWEFSAQMDAAAVRSASAARTASAAWSNTTAFTATREALAALNEAVARGDQQAAAAATSQLALAQSLTNTGAAGGTAARGITTAATAAEALQNQLGKGADAVTSLFSAITGGGGGVAGALARILQQIAEAQFRYALLQAATGGGGGWLAGLGRLLMPGNARGTNSWAGGWSMVGEEGAELVNLPTGATVSPAAETRGLLRDMGRGGSAGQVTVTVGVDQSGNLVPVIESISGSVAARVVGAFDRVALPGRVHEINADPRAI